MGAERSSVFAANLVPLKPHGRRCAAEAGALAKHVTGAPVTAWAPAVDEEICADEDMVSCKKVWHVE